MTLMTSSLSFCTTLYFYMFVVIGLHSHVTWGHTNNREFKREREREDGGVSKREKERERRKSHHITRRTRGKVVIRIALIPPPTPPPALSKLLSLEARATLFLCETVALRGWSGMRWIWCRNSLLKDNAAKLKCAPAGSHGTACR